MKFFIFTIFTSMFTSLLFANVELITRYNQEGSYSKGAYNFFYESQDEEKTGNGFDVQFEDRSDFAGYFNSVMVTDQVGSIIDLGLISCKDIPNSYEQKGEYPGVNHGGYPYKEDRKFRPMFWLEYSDAWMSLQKGSSSKANVFEGHCYLLQRINSDYLVTVLFHVNKYIKGRSVILDEIELFNKQKLVKLKKIN